MVGDPDVLFSGVPRKTREGGGIDALVDGAIFETFENLPRGKRRDPDAVAETIERAVRNAINGVWGKKPVVHVLVVEV
jgi:ribonuclease J